MKDDSENEADALRAEIDETRRRLDETLDDIGGRLRPRHLLDEILGFFRGENADGDSHLTAMREKITRGASQAASSVVRSIKENPLPALVIGAGVAWMLYESRREKSPRAEDTDTEPEYDPAEYYDRPLEYPPASGSPAQMEFKNDIESELDEVRDPAGEPGERAPENAATFGEKAREKLANAKEKAGAAYTRTRDRVTSTAREHPLEVGLACLAAGLLVGLALPTPGPVDRAAGPTASRLRRRARSAGSEVLEKSKRVARAAAEAAKSEAQVQGLTSQERAPEAASASDSAPHSGSGDPTEKTPGQ